MPSITIGANKVTLRDLKVTKSTVTFTVKGTRVTVPRTTLEALTDTRPVAKFKPFYYWINPGGEVNTTTMWPQGGLTKCGKYIATWSTGTTATAASLFANKHGLFSYNLADSTSGFHVRRCLTPIDAKSLGFKF